LTHDIRILSIDSAATLCSVAAQSSEKRVFRESKAGEKHTEVILGMIRQAADELGLSLSGVDAVAFGAGPGAFTGLRVSCGIAQGIAWALNKPLIPVGNLEALAFASLDMLQEGQKILAAVDARMQECYYALYEKREGGLVELTAPSLIRPSEIAAEFHRNKAAKFCGNAALAYSDEITLPSDAVIGSLTVADAEMILNLALVRYSQGKTVSPEEAHPLYVRNHVAMTIDERKAAKLNNAR
jgi:tRNA threonylcarbamoyladenosine biosynthesis protein TsaB